jgi:hypothetical protein
VLPNILFEFVAIFLGTVRTDTMSSTYQIIILRDITIYLAMLMITSSALLTDVDVRHFSSLAPA